MNYKKGDWIAFQSNDGDISIYKFHSMRDDSVVNVYLTADMKTEHTHCKTVRNILPMDKLKEMLFGETK